PGQRDRMREGALARVDPGDRLVVLVRGPDGAATDVDRAGPDADGDLPDHLARPRVDHADRVRRDDESGAGSRREYDADGDAGHNDRTGCDRDAPPPETRPQTGIESSQPREPRRQVGSDDLVEPN